MSVVSASRTSMSRLLGFAHAGEICLRTSGVQVGGGLEQLLHKARRGHIRSRTMAAGRLTIPEPWS